MTPHKIVAQTACLFICAATLQLTGCGGDSATDNSARISGVSTGGTGESITPGLGGGSDTNAALDTNANSGVVVNSPSQPPLLATEATLSAYPFHLVQSQDSVQFYDPAKPSVVKYTLTSQLKPEGIVPTIDGAVLLFSTPAQTGYQIISFDGAGTPLASKVYGIDGKVMAIRYQQASSHSYFIDLLINNDHNTSALPYSHQRFKIADGVMTTGKKTIELNQKIITAASNSQYLIWIGRDNAKSYWLNALDCSASSTTCTQLTPVKLDGDIDDSETNPRSAPGSLQLVGDDIQVRMIGQTVSTTFIITGANVTLKP